MGLFQSFHPDSPAIVNPTDSVSPLPGFPQRVIVTYSRHKHAAMLDGRAARPLTVINTSAMAMPVVAVEEAGEPIATLLCSIGAPDAAGVLEELIALGGRRFLYYGSCGVLDHDILAGHIAVPTHAYRDEGVSYHYLPPDDYIKIPTADTLCSLLDELGVPHHRTRTWTTDAIYRETRRNLARRRAEGCRVVEMECAATAAVAAFRDVAFYQFVYGADSLAGPTWDRRTLNEAEHDDHHQIAGLALQLAARLP